MILEEERSKMKKVKAQKYSLLKDFDFVEQTTCYNGQGILLIPEDATYHLKVYDFRELELIPYLQEPFNKNEGITIEELTRRINIERSLLDTDSFSLKILSHLRSDNWKRDSNELNEEEIIRKGLMDNQTLFKILTKLYFHNIIRHKKVRGEDDKFNLEEVLEKGKNYDTTRVRSLTYSPRSQY